MSLNSFFLCKFEIFFLSNPAGRDHGLPPYNDFRQFCGLPRACSWSQPPKEADPELWAQLGSIYRSPADVDLFAGGLVETNHHQEDGVVGETFRCLIGKQFEALKYGDRFFYTFQVWETALFQNSKFPARPARFKDKDGPLRFTPRQLDNLVGRTLGDILCDNTDLVWMRTDAFFLDTKWLKCGNHNKLDMGLFLDSEHWLGSWRTV